MKQPVRHLPAIIGLIVLAGPVETIAKPQRKAKAAVVDAPESWPRDGVQGYAVLSKENGDGETQRVDALGAMATLPALIANDVDYIEVVGSQTQVTVYADPNFRGKSLTLRCGNYELLQQPRNDIESIRVTYVRDDARCQGSEARPVQFTTWGR